MGGMTLPAGFRETPGSHSLIHGSVESNPAITGFRMSHASRNLGQHPTNAAGGSLRPQPASKILQPAYVQRGEIGFLVLDR